MEPKYLIILATVVILSVGCVDNVQESMGNATASEGKSALQACIDACGAGNSPVCSMSNVTYNSHCIMKCHGGSLQHLGECEKAEQEAQPNWCNDTDGGVNLLEKGTVTSSKGNGIDFCVNDSVVEEYSCSLNMLARQPKDCPEGHDCADGACVPRPGGCIDSNGTVTLNGRSYADSCNSIFIVKDYFCRNGTVENVVNQCPNGQRCSSGRCVNITFSCNDSDGGEDIYEKGAVTVFSDAGSSEIFYDSCQEDNEIKEYFCIDGRQDYRIRECPSDHECVSGRCREADCVDSDGGKDEDVYGIVTKGGDEEQDRCSSGTRVVEYYCYRGDIEHVTITCDGECNGGRCVATP